MMENRQENYVELRVGFETVEEAVFTIMKNHKMVFEGNIIDLSFCF